MALKRTGPDGKIKAALPLVDLLLLISGLRRAAGKGVAPLPIELMRIALPTGFSGSATLVRLINSLDIVASI